MRKLAPRARGILPAALAVAVLGLSGPAGGAGFRIFQSTAVLDRPLGEPMPGEFGLGASGAAALATGQASEGAFHLDLRFPSPPTIAPSDASLGSPRLSAPPPRPRRFWIGAASAGAVVGSAYNAFADDGFSERFRFTNEGWFGANTYVGGGDKASHIVSFYGVSRLLTGVYELLNVPTERSYRLAAGVSFVAGLATEIGDATNPYGFSYEDLVLDAAGAASAYFLAHYDLDDMIGFRAGLVPAPENPEEERVDGIGKDYTKEIYTADFKLAGLARRLDRKFGPARFLLLSLSYSAKGYPYATPELRERQVGLEVGLNVAEIARTVGVSEKRWWGKMLLIVLDIVRFPYTAVGVRYDLNHHRWRGPDTGEGFEFPGR